MPDRRHVVADRDRRHHDQPAARRHRDQAGVGDGAAAGHQRRRASTRTAQPVPNGGGGYLVLTEPWPAMLRGIWGDDERYLDTYWSRFARVLLRRRRREAGRRRRPLAARPGRRRDERLRPPDLDDRGRVGAGLAPVGRRGGGRRRDRRDHRPGDRRVRDPARRGPSDGGATWRRELRDHVAQEIGPIAKPRQILVVAELPKTRSGKIMRRLLRDVAENRDLGDVTTLGGPDRDEPDRRSSSQRPQPRTD